MQLKLRYRGCCSSMDFLEQTADKHIGDLWTVYYYGDEKRKEDYVWLGWKKGWVNLIQLKYGDFEYDVWEEIAPKKKRTNHRIERLKELWYR